MQQCDVREGVEGVGESVRVGKGDGESVRLTTTLGKLVFNSKEAEEVFCELERVLRRRNCRILLRLIKYVDIEGFRGWYRKNLSHI